MRKTLVTLLAAASCATFSAHADGKPITVQLTYDSTLLATEASAKTVLKSIKSQAKEACTFTTPATGRVSFDRVCRDDLVNKAIEKIRLAAIEDGQPTAYVFASLESDADTLNQ